jgi:hypothetical protein
VCELAENVVLNARRDERSQSHSEGCSNREKHAVFTTLCECYDKMCRGLLKQSLLNAERALALEQTRRFPCGVCATQNQKFLLSRTSLDYGYDCESGNTYMPWFFGKASGVLPAAELASSSV